MTPRRAFIAGNLMLAGCGVLMIGFFGWPICQWYLSGDFWFGGVNYSAHYDRVPPGFVIQFALCVLFTWVGLVCLITSFIVPFRYRKRLFSREP
jgi:hypothetical protein